jgi:16S rRNA processing protein RimM
MVVEHCWEHQGRQVLKFSSIDSIGDAERLTGAWVEIEADQAVQLPPGTYWDDELIGCRLCNLRGETLGVVTQVLRIAGNDQLLVQGNGAEYMVPVVAAICREISIEHKEIVVDLPEGLISLNP